MVENKQRGISFMSSVRGIGDSYLSQGVAKERLGEMHFCHSDTQEKAEEVAFKKFKQISGVEKKESVEVAETSLDQFFLQFQFVSDLRTQLTSIFGIAVYEANSRADKLVRKLTEFGHFSQEQIVPLAIVLHNLAVKFCEEDQSFEVGLEKAFPFLQSSLKSVSTIEPKVIFKQAWLIYFVENQLTQQVPVLTNLNERAISLIDIKDDEISLTRKVLLIKRAVETFSLDVNIAFELVKKVWNSQEEGNDYNEPAMLRDVGLLNKEMILISPFYTNFEEALDALDLTVAFQHLRAPNSVTLEIYRRVETVRIFRLLNKTHSQNSTPSAGTPAYSSADKLLGSGSSAKAKKCLDLETKQEFCRLSERNGRTNIELVRRLKGKRGLVQILEISSEYAGKKLAVQKQAVIEDLYDFSLESIPAETQIDAAGKKAIALDLLHGLINMHAEGIVHKDLKPANILIRRNLQIGQYEGVITDFDLAGEFTGSEVTGTVYFMAPEAIKYLANRRSAPVNMLRKDTWEMGRCLLELYSQELQNSPLLRLKTLNSDCLKERPRRCPRLEDFQAATPLPTDPPIAHFIYRLMRFDPNDRPSAADALKEFQQLFT